jgi:hypothetical protein
MIKVISTGKATAVVSTKNLVRIVIQPGGKVVRELCSKSNAKTFTDAYNSVPGKTRAEIVKYPQ